MSREWTAELWGARPPHPARDGFQPVSGCCAVPPPRDPIGSVASAALGAWVCGRHEQELPETLALLFLLLAGGMRLGGARSGDAFICSNSFSIDSLGFPRQVVVLAAHHQTCVSFQHLLFLLFPWSPELAGTPIMAGGPASQVERGRLACLPQAQHWPRFLEDSFCCR